MARIPYRDPDDAPEPIREVIAETPLALLRIVAHADTAFEPWLRYSNTLLRRLELDPLLRELAILQVAHLSDSEYEWTQHVPIAESFGASAQAIAAIEAGRDEDESLAEEHRAILSFTREVVVDGAAGEEAVEAMRARLGERQARRAAAGDRQLPRPRPADRHGRSRAARAGRPAPGRHRRARPFLSARAGTPGARRRRLSSAARKRPTRDSARSRRASERRKL